MVLQQASVFLAVSYTVDSPTRSSFLSETMSEPSLKSPVSTPGSYIYGPRRYRNFRSFLGRSDHTGKGPLFCHRPGTPSHKKRAGGGTWHPLATRTWMAVPCRAPSPPTWGGKRSAPSFASQALGSQGLLLKNNFFFSSRHHSEHPATAH